MKDYQSKRKEAWALIMANRKAKSPGDAAARKNQDSTLPSKPSDSEITVFDSPKKLMEFLQSGR